MQACVREMDMVSRIGGDEFIVFLTKIETSSACRQTQISYCQAHFD